MPLAVFEVPTELYAPAGVIGGRTPRQATILLIGGLLGGLCVLVPALFRWPMIVMHDPWLGFPLPLSVVPGGLVFAIAMALQIDDWDGLSMTTWLGLAWRYWRMPKETLLWRPEWGVSPGRHSVQEMHVQVERTTADQLVVPEGRRGILALERMPSLGMATEDEQMDCVRRYARWLNGLHGLADHVQLLLVAGDEDTRGHLRAKRTRRYPSLPEAMREYGDGYEQLIATLGRGLLRRRHYVVVPEPHDPNQGLEELVGAVARGVRRIGPEPVRVSDIRELLRNQWRPGEDRPLQVVHDRWTPLDRDEKHAADSPAIPTAAAN